MVTVYIIFVAVLVASFITGNIVLYMEHKSRGKKLMVEKGSLIDEDVL